MKLSEVMTRHVEVIHPDATLQEGAEKMKSLNVGSLPVCDGERLQGMITDRDITVRATVEGRDPASVRVSDVMTPEVAYCHDDQDVQAAADLMAQKQIRRLPIVDRNKRLVGIVALGDMAVDAGDEELSGDVLESVSEPLRPQR